MAIKTEKQPQAQKLLNYFGVPEEYGSQDNSQVVIVPCPYEPTEGKGTKNGPKAIHDASLHVELFDDELWTEPHKIGIYSHRELKMPPAEASDEAPFKDLCHALKPIMESGKFPIVIGGEHSITIGAAAAFAERFANLSVLQVNAHATCRKTYEGNPYNHGCVAYQLYNNVLEKPLITQVGTRSINSEEAVWIEETKPNINTFWARHQERWNYHEIVSTLTDDVYLTIDLDALDSGIMPSTSSPEPGGMTWQQLTELVKVLCIKKNVVGADIVNLSPIKNLQAPDFLAAKLLYKLIGYRFALDLGVTKKYL